MFDYRHAVFYQVWPRSFCDSDGDGIGETENAFVLLNLSNRPQNVRLNEAVAIPKESVLSNYRTRFAAPQMKLQPYEAQLFLF